MFKIHDVRLKQNYDAFDVVCKKEKIDFFTMINLVKLLQETLDYDEYILGNKIEFSRVKDKLLLERLKVQDGKRLFEICEKSFSIKPEIYNLLERIYEIQKENDKKYEEYCKCCRVYIWYDKKY